MACATGPTTTKSTWLAFSQRSTAIELRSRCSSPGRGCTDLASIPGERCLSSMLVRFAPGAPTPALAGHRRPGGGPVCARARAPADSPLEDEFREFCAKYGQRQPEMNFPLHGRRLDAFFPEYGVIVELDGSDFHKDQQAFEDDRERDADHLDHELVTIRITKTRFEQQPDD